MFCLHECLYTMGVPSVQRRVWDPLNWGLGWLGATTWVLGKEFLSYPTSPYFSVLADPLFILLSTF